MKRGLKVISRKVYVSNPRSYNRFPDEKGTESQSTRVRVQVVDMLQPFPR